MADGWAQQGIQIPHEFREAFRKEAADLGHSSIKTMGTLAIGVLLGMPPQMRTWLCVWMQRMIATYGDDLDPGDIYREFAREAARQPEPRDMTEAEVLGLMQRAIRDFRALGRTGVIQPTEQPGTKREERQGDG